MPELPEVEVVRRGLEPHVVGRAFESVEVLHPRANRGQDAPLDALLKGRVISGLGRRGKYLWCELNGEDDVLFVHLGMSGQLRIGHTDSKHVRIRSHLTDGVDCQALLTSALSAIGSQHPCQRLTILATIH